MMDTLSRWWTGFLLLLTAAAVIAWLCAWLHEHGIRPCESLKKAAKTTSLGGLAALALWAAPLIQYGSTKGGNGGTNNVPQQVAKPIDGLLPMEQPGVTDNLESRQGQLTDGLSEAAQTQSGLSANDIVIISSTNTTRTLTVADFERGFVHTRTGTAETHDFSPPENAVICDDWRAFGAAEDWVYVALTNWMLTVGTNETERLRVFSFGKIEPLVRDGEGNYATNTWFAPFMASLGVVPQANWPLLADAASPSQFWYAITPQNSLLLTWQNVLLDRLADKPVSFQVEFFANGQFVYRYDLSRHGTDSIAATIGASSAGNEWTTNAIPANVTSMSFYPLTGEDMLNHDPDKDGLATIDELFVYGTDPRNADTDYDGLTDYEELFVYNTDPLDPHSIRDDYCDGIAVRMGDIDPFDYPEGSTNTVLEHVFYSGTTNGVFAYPQSSDGMAVLQVSVSGSGTGDLIVGDKVVPLVAPPAQQSPMNVPNGIRLMGAASASAHPPLLVQLVKGQTYPLYLRTGDELLEVALNSADFAFGVLPTLNSAGWINFPNTVAETPCIHDFNARKKTISLPTSSGAELLKSTWSSSSADVSVSNHPPRSAEITGNFSARTTKSISYTLSHPDYLFGQKTYTQTVRFCPKLEDDDDDDDNDAPWYSGGGGGGDDQEDHWCCYWGTCGTWCGCGCDCGDNDDDEDGPDDDEDFDEECPDHNMPYEDCAYLHEDEYTNAVQNVQHLGGVLYIRDPPVYEQITLEVPTEHRNCCPCPDHWTNYVGVAYKSHHLRLLDSNGADFKQTENSCSVNLAGIHPSSAVGDATLAFVRNGEIYRQYDKTVLGVAVKGDNGVDLAAYNALNSDFGYPMTVCTNVWNAPSIKLVTNVKLPDGKIHLELADATGQFTVWYLDRRTWEYRKLLDTDATPVKDLSMAYWKGLMKRATYGESAELPIYITSSSPGSVSLKFRYWNTIGDEFVQDEAVQRITSLLPPLRLDISHDGAIDDGDSAAWFDNRTFYYWTNQDTIKGDRIGQTSNSSPNSGDLQVNGTFDLVNFFPVALDLSKFTDAWQNRVTYTIHPEWGNTNSFNFCFADIPWNQSGSIQTATTTTLVGQTLSSASLESLPKTGYQLHYNDTLMRFSANSGLMICEAKSRYAAMRIDIMMGDTLLYSYSAPMTILPVKEMYNWYNFRNFSNENSGRGTEFHTLWEEDYSKSLVFLHGANVTSSDAEDWGDIVFKRMWLSGARARFYNVDWRSDIGSDANYHENASNAFVVASQIASTIKAIPGEKIVMAHSLGNMVVSSMIQDYGLQVSKYLMCNSAVPAEAYDTRRSIRVPQLVHSDWEDYPTNSWAASWHTLFAADSDDRKHLGWPGRFSDVLEYVAADFYSTGDEVLELAADNDVGIFTGITSSLAHHSWHKQELFKGRGLGVGAGATDWSGWNIDENWLGINKISVSEALKMSDNDFKTNTVFYCYPDSMNSPTIPLLVRGAHLSLGIPALAPAAGAQRFGSAAFADIMVDVNEDNANGVERVNGWPSLSSYSGRWCHSDIKNVSFFFNFKFYQKLVEKGALR